MIVVFRPAIEREIQQRASHGRDSLCARSNRAGIAHPSAIGGHVKKRDRLERRARFSSGFARTRASAARFFDQQIHALHTRQVPHDFRKRPRYRRKFARPVGQLVRPAKPCRLVRLPFGGHAVAMDCRARAHSAGPCHRRAHHSQASGSESARRRPCAGRAGMANCAASSSLFARIAFDHQDFFLVAATPRRRSVPNGSAHKRIAPKFEARIAMRRIPFESNAIHGGDVTRRWRSHAPR